ncbi:MAG: hypothetical protein AB1508_17635 [Pseudomonadota bacterium]
MRMLLKIRIPAEAGTRAIKDGSMGQLFEGILSKLKPEAAYFVAEDGLRTAMIFFDMKDTSEIPSIAEPFFAGLDAKIEIQPVMNADDLKKGLSALK